MTIDLMTIEKSRFKFLYFYKCDAHKDLFYSNAGPSPTLSQNVLNIKRLKR